MPYIDFMRVRSKSNKSKVVYSYFDMIDWFWSDSHKQTNQITIVKIAVILKE